MNEARKVIFAGAGFAGDEESRGRRSDLFRKFEEAARGGVFGDPRKAIGHGLIVTGRGWKKWLVTSGEWRENNWGGI